MTVHQLLDSGFSHYQAGRVAEAEKIYREILAQHPDNPDALHLLGMLAGRVGKLDAAVDLIRRAIAIHPASAPYHNSLANALKSKGQPAEAIASYREAIRLEPEFADAHNNLGTVLSDIRQLDAAIDSYREAIRLKPDLCQAHNNLGNALRDKGQPDAAIASYQQAIRFGPGFAEVHNNLGAALLDEKRFEEAIAAFGHAIRIKPDFAEAHSNLGNALNDNGQLDRAIAAYSRAIQINPDYAEAYYNLGNTLKDAEQLDQAIACYRQALRIKPNYVDVHNNLGNALSDKGECDDAIASYRQAIAIEPHGAKAHSNLGNVLMNTGQHDQAIASHRRAVELSPDLPAAHSNLLVAIHYHRGFDAEMIREEHRCWNERHARPLRRFIQAHSNDANPNRRLRIGYVSPDFLDHPVGRLILPLLSAHNRDQFEIFCYSDVRRSDRVTALVREHADQWQSIVGLSDEHAAGMIRDDRIDILVDLTMHVANNRLLLFARKPAPVQATYLAYCSTTGLEAMDYRLTDPHFDSPGTNDSYYSEKSIRLPETYWCYPIDDQSPEVGPLLALDTGEITFGCLNNFAKVSSDALNLWIELLHAVPKSRLILHAHQGGHRQRVWEMLQHGRIDPQRLKFSGKVPLHKYFALHGQIDIGLDPFPFTGGTTTCDALWMGVPVVTLSGQTAVGRGGSSILTNIGLPELIARTRQEYTEIAIGLAKDLARLAELRHTLRSRMQASPLMDAPRFARNVEAAYRQMWRNWCAEGRYSGLQCPSE